MNEWISVKDRLPEPDVMVLVFNSELRRPEFRGEPLNPGIRLGRRTLSGMLRPDGCTGFDETTTYWMPLPDPPVEAK